MLQCMNVLAHKLTLLIKELLTSYNYIIFHKKQQTHGSLWRKREDSLHRYGYQHTRFPRVILKPLGHTSALEPFYHTYQNNQTLTLFYTTYA